MLHKNILCAMTALCGCSRTMKYLVLPAFLVATAATTLAQDVPAFSDLDVNADGELSMEEVPGAGDFDLTTADENGDGVITEDEYNAHVDRSKKKGD